MFSRKLVTFAFCVLYSLTALAELSLQSQETITDSEEPFGRRIYSYDFDVSSEGVVHAVYSKPVVGSNLADIIYMSKKVGENWPKENSRVVLETAGQLSSVSTNLIVDNASNTVHISYIVERDFIDSNGVMHNSGLVYQKIISQQPGEKVSVSSGGFHTLMQLNENGEAIFIREYENFLDTEGALRKAPFPKALRIHSPLGNNQWTDREHILNLPAAEDYRLANFIYDTTTGRYHIAYGNKNAQFLRDTYPTTNPPVVDASSARPFPAGAGHELMYAFSDDLENWQSSTIDNSGTLSENEFWTDLIVNEEKVHAATYRYGTDAVGVHQGTSTVLGTLSGDSWNLITVAGKTTGASAHRAGMGAKILIDEAGGFHGLWDNSPDAPIDSESAQGTVMYRFSPDGIKWETHQAILPFSGEGKIRAKFYQDKLLVMLLADATDAKIVFSELKVPAPSANLMEISTDKMFYGVGETINLYARLQGVSQAPSDLYFIVAGPYDKAASGDLIPTMTTAFHYLGADFNWHQVSALLDTQPVLSSFALTGFNDFFKQVIAKTALPFSNPGRYRLYNVATVAGSALQNFNTLTPLYSYDLHVCNLVNCVEIVSQ